MSTTRVWKSMLSDLLTYGHDASQRSAGAAWKGNASLEIMGYQTKLPLDLPVVQSVAKAKAHRFMLAEAAWILSGDNRVGTISPFSQQIKRFSDDGARFFGAYGPKFIEQMSYVVSTLRKDPGSRQAVINIWREQPRTTSDCPCTLSWQYLVRAGHLHMVATMRSSDAWTGWPIDVFTFSMTAAAIAIELRVANPKTGEPAPSTFLDLKLGSLIVTVGSQHLYNRDAEVATKAMTEPDPRPSDFTPLSLHEFASTAELTDHLWALARGDETERRFGREFNP